MHQNSTAGLVARELKTLMGLPPSHPLVQSIISCVYIHIYHNIYIYIYIYIYTVHHLLRLYIYTQSIISCVYIYIYTNTYIYIYIVHHLLRLYIYTNTFGAVHHLLRLRDALLRTLLLHDSDDPVTRMTRMARTCRRWRDVLLWGRATAVRDVQLLEGHAGGTCLRGHDDVADGARVEATQSRAAKGIYIYIYGVFGGHM
jgi:hypothetical protein